MTKKKVFLDRTKNRPNDIRGTNWLLVLVSFVILLVIGGWVGLYILQHKDHEKLNDIDGMVKTVLREIVNGSGSVNQQYAFVPFAQNAIMDWEPGPLEWGGWGQDINNSKWARSERLISTDTASSLELEWTFRTNGFVPAHPSVVTGAACFCSWGGTVYCIDSFFGDLLWSKNLSDYTNIAGSFCRHTPTIYNGDLFVGDQLSGNLLSLDALDGSLNWIQLVDEHPAAIITSPPSVYRGMVFVLVSSSEESFANNNTYPCCTFIGSVASYTAKDGVFLWKTFILPPNGGQPGAYAGAASWGAFPVVLPQYHMLFITTGNLYSVPENVANCLNETQNRDHPENCREDGDMSNSIIALDFRTGDVIYYYNVSGPDVWTVACIFSGGPNCKSYKGPDYDFGQGVMLFEVLLPNGKRVLAVGAGQKSGIFWTLEALTGKLIWAKVTGPGGITGGQQWGSAYDDRHIYVQNTNTNKTKYALPNGQIACGGFWMAMDKNTGATVWITPTPGSLKGSQCDNASLVTQTNSSAMGTVTVANSGRRAVVFGADTAGSMNVMDSNTGAILKSFPVIGTGFSGASISQGRVYFGSGYRSDFGFVPNNLLYMASLP